MWNATFTVPPEVQPEDPVPAKNKLECGMRNNHFHLHLHFL